MGLDSKELGIDLNCRFSCANSFSDVLSEISVIEDKDVKSIALNEYVYHLEEELRKVDGFKRELPLSVNLLTDAILRLKEEVLELNRRDVVVKEKIAPLKGNSGEKGVQEVWDDKKDWMSSVQLWSVPVQMENTADAARIPDSKLLPQAGKEAGKRDRTNPLVEEKWSKKGAINVEVKEELVMDGNLSLSIPVSLKESNTEKNSVKPEMVLGSSQQQNKKQRRCWSEELHRSFVNALMNLGGPEVATPKQIREIMQVDGLTNDEVKSHLQKYRLHISKVKSARSSSSGEMPNTGPWLKRYKSSKTMAMAPSSGSPEGPLHSGGSAKGLSLTVGEEEDTKSESLSWNGHFLKPC
ncbi:OLC1v1010084C1 [Oldenlandia corymbosa var. corymbosa]|uniref:OLC1v1010084C1 n=1 Tax=Oldenlandia corymbosa var. corymbosa TaxID=529605 RepID=A0AAV1DTF2_OLDCO|nr:OLC1v1010084C1 [Oldenlandia corymbosa var. corymbosa]